MFAFGVTLFRLLSGERPFPSNNTQILKRHTVELRYNVSSGDWENISAAAKDMIRKLLINSEQRLTAEEALSHRWFKEEGGTILPVDFSHIGGPGGGQGQADSRSRAVVRVSRPYPSKIFILSPAFYRNLLHSFVTYLLISLFVVSRTSNRISCSIRWSILDRSKSANRTHHDHFGWHLFRQRSFRTESGREYLGDDMC